MWRYQIILIFQPKEGEALKLLRLKLALVLLHERADALCRFVRVLDEKAGPSMLIIVRRPEKKCPCFYQRLNASV